MPIHAQVSLAVQKTKKDNDDNSFDIPQHLVQHVANSVIGGEWRHRVQIFCIIAMMVCIPQEETVSPRPMGMVRPPMPLSRGRTLTITSSTASTGHNTQPGSSGNSNTRLGNNIKSNSSRDNSNKERAGLSHLHHLPQTRPRRRIPTTCWRGPSTSWWSTRGRST